MDIEWPATQPRQGQGADLCLFHRGFVQSLINIVRDGKATSCLTTSSVFPTLKAQFLIYPFFGQEAPYVVETTFW